MDVSFAFNATTTAPTPDRFFASKHASQDGPHGIGEGTVGELSREAEDRGHGNVVLHGIAQLHVWMEGWRLQTEQYTALV